MNNDLRVTLDASEIQKVYTLTDEMVLRLQRRNAKGAHGGTAVTNVWQREEAIKKIMIGIGGEAAVAKYFNIAWDGNGEDLKKPDVGPFEVRTSPRVWGDMIMHEQDHDDRIYILVFNNMPEFTIKGWAWGIDCKKPEYWRDPTGKRAAFFVPQSKLHPIKKIPPQIYRKYVVDSVVQSGNSTTQDDRVLQRV